MHAKDFAAAAEGMVDVRWRSHGREPHIGLDCGGLLVAALARVGVHVDDSRQYDPRMPGAAFLWRMLRANCDEQDLADQGEGRIGLCRWETGDEPRHLVVMLSGHRIVHVDANARRVVVVPAGWLWGRLLSVFRVRALQYGEPWSQ